MNIQKIGKKGAMTGMLALSMIIGATSAMFFRGNQVNAQTPTTQAQVTSPPPVATSPTPSIQHGMGQDGKFHSNEDPTHEAGESAAREAQENAGQMPTVK